MAERIRPTLRGWLQYYGRFHRSALIYALRTVDIALVHWAQRKYKRLHVRSELVIEHGSADL
ncbi:group II intron maturase-specific domain-containing protein [Cupriavidus lacunae]|uniref:group II intron maturase-specific domain-containing protein n=1 Tax=Cupriavidus lacunae TaxID=2666307 RepID=UPI001ABF9DFF